MSVYILQCPKCERHFSIQEGSFFNCPFCSNGEKGIRVKVTIEINYPVSKDKKKQISMKNLGNCVYCGDIATTKDHVIPKSRGGKTTLPCCLRCNAAKSDLPLSKFLQKVKNDAPIFYGKALSSADKLKIINGINYVISLKILK